MARTTSGTPKKEPFVSKKDRPDVKITLDTPLSELRVRELSAILAMAGGKHPNFEVGSGPLKNFFDDKGSPDVVKDFLKEVKIEKIESPEKPPKFEKLEKIEKPEKPEKIEKYEKFEKPEIKENKNEKLEREPVFDPGDIIPDPRLEQVIQAVAGLTRQVSQLANQIEELRKKTG